MTVAALFEMWLNTNGNKTVSHFIMSLNLRLIERFGWGGTIKAHPVPALPWAGTSSPRAGDSAFVPNVPPWGHVGFCRNGELIHLVGKKRL